MKLLGLIVLLIWTGSWLGAFLHQTYVKHEVNEEIATLKKENEELRRRAAWSEELSEISLHATDRCADVLQECMSFLDLNYSVKLEYHKEKRGNTEEGQGKGLGATRKGRIEALWKDACGGG